MLNRPLDYFLLEALMIPRTFLHSMNILDSFDDIHIISPYCNLGDDQGVVLMSFEPEKSLLANIVIVCFFAGLAVLWSRKFPLD